MEDHIPSRYLLATRGDAALATLRAQGVTHVLAGTNAFLRKPYQFLDEADWIAQYDHFEDVLEEAALAGGGLGL